MTKEQLVGIVKRFLETDSDQSFLAKLTNFELENLLAVMRDRIENPR